MAKPDPVVVVGAGPVGLCLALALAQQDVAVVLVEAMSDDNFLDQVPRAGSNHPTTLEFFDRIGLYAKMEPRGIIAPKFQYWDRQDNALIAEFDHALLKDDTRFPYVLQCERIKIIEEALTMAKAHPLIDGADGDGVRFVRAERRRGAGAGQERRRRNRDHQRQLSGQRRRRAQHRAEGSQRRVRGLHLSGAHHQHRGRLRFPQARLHRAQLHLRSGRIFQSVPLEGPAGPLAHPLPDQHRRRRERAEAARGAAAAPAEIPRHRPRFRDLRLQSLHGASARREEVPLGPRGARRRLRPRQQPDRRHGTEQRRARRLQSRRQAGPHPAWRGRRGGARPIRTAAAARGGQAHPGADHPQQAAAGGARPGRAPAQPRRVAAAGRRPGAGAQVPAADRAV